MNITLSTLGYYDTVNATTGTLYYATKGYVSSGTATPPHTFFDARLKQAGRLKRTMFGDGTTRGKSKVGTGEVVLLNNDGDLDALRNYAFDGRTYTEYYGPETATFPGGFTVTLVATFDSQPDFSKSNEVRLRLRDRISKVKVPLQATKYAGNNVLPAGLEGVEDLLGRPKPWCYGKVYNVPAVLVNTSKLIYQVHDGAISSLAQVRDSGVPLDYTDLSWVARTSGVGTRLYDMATDGAGVWVAVGESGVVRRSTDDGVTWAAATTSMGTDVLNSVGYDPVIDKFVLGRDGGLWYSTDGGDNWTACTDSLVATEIPTRIVSNGTGTFVTASGSGDGAADRVMSSTDGITFTDRTHGFGGTDPKTCCWGRNVFVVMNGSRIESSPTGVTWTLVSTIVPGSGTVMHLEYGNDVYVLSRGGSIYSSVDLLSWSLRYTFQSSTTSGMVKWGGGRRAFYAVGGTTTASWEHEVAFSYDGVIWETIKSVLGVAITGTGVGLDPFSQSSVMVCGWSGTLAQVRAWGDTYSSLADLEDDTLAPVPGGLKTYNAGGYFRLGSRPAGQITCDVVMGSTLPGTGLAGVLTEIGLGAYYSAADVTVLDAAKPYAIGFWSGLDEWDAADVMDWMAGSVGAWWGPDSTGTFRFKVGPDSTGTSVLTVTANDMLGPPQLLATSDEGNGRPWYRVALGYQYNWLPLNELASSVAASEQALMRARTSYNTAVDATVQTSYELARNVVIDSLLYVKADAATVAAALLALYDSRQDLIEFVLPITPETSADVLALDLGQVVTVKHSRFGLSAGRNFAIVTIDRDPAAGRVLIQAYAAA